MQYLEHAGGLFQSEAAMLDPDGAAYAGLAKHGSETPLPSAAYNHIGSAFHAGPPACADAFMSIGQCVISTQLCDGTAREASEADGAWIHRLSTGWLAKGSRPT